MEKRKDIAAISVFFNFFKDPQRVKNAVEAYEKMNQFDVRVFTLEIVLEGEQSELDFDDVTSVNVKSRLFYKVPGINWLAKRLIEQGFEYIAWVDSDYYCDDPAWGEKTVAALREHKLVHCHETLLIDQDKRNSILVQDNLIADGGAWAAHKSLFTEAGGLFPYSIAEGGNKILLAPFIERELVDSWHPVANLPYRTRFGEALEAYWHGLKAWMGNARPGTVSGIHGVLLPHGSQKDREIIVYQRYKIYEHLNPETDLSLNKDGLIELTNPSLQRDIERMLKVRESVSNPILSTSLKKILPWPLYFWLFRQPRIYLEVIDYYVDTHGLIPGITSCLLGYPKWLFFQTRLAKQLHSDSPWLSFEAIDYLKQIVEPSFKVFEFGSGGSTLFFARYCQSVYSLEHSREWYTTVLDQLHAKKIQNCTLELLENDPDADYDPFSPYASKVRRGQSYRNYAHKLDEFDDASFDLILIDGRARLACLAHSISKVKPGGYLILDDSHRPHYAKALTMVPTDWRRKTLKGKGPWTIGKDVIKETSIWQRPE